MVFVYFREPDYVIVDSAKGPFRHIKRFPDKTLTGLLHSRQFFVFVLLKQKNTGPLEAARESKFGEELLPPVVYDEASIFCMDMS